MTATHPQPLDLEPIRRRIATLNGAWDHEYATPDAPSKAIASAEDVPALLTEVERLRADNDRLRMFERIYLEASEALDVLLGPDEEDGCGQGLVAEIWHLARRCEHFENATEAAS
jgi:hypothetical protein